MILIATYSYTQSSPRGGQSYSTTENVVVVATTENEVQDKINSFIKDDKCGYRKNIKLIDLKRI